MTAETTVAPIITDIRQVLTASRLKVARSCRRQHHLQYDLGYRAVVEAETTRFGTLVHHGQEAWWRAGMNGVEGDARLEVAIVAVRMHAAPETDAYELARAEAMMTGYHLRWKDEPYDVLAVEAHFECDLVNPATGQASRTWKLAGKIDVIVRDRRTGLILVVEHKTSSEDIGRGTEYWRRLRMDGQVSVYYVGAASLGHQVGGCLYDVLGKPRLQPSQVPLTDDDGVKIVLDFAGQRVRTKDGKKWRQTADTEAGYVLQTRAETVDEYRARLMEALAAEPDRYFARGDVVRLEQEMADAMLDVWQLGQELREADRAGRYPRNPGACVQYGRTCQFFDVCTGCASLDDSTRFRRIDDVHPELQQEPQ